MRSMRKAIATMLVPVLALLAAPLAAQEIETIDPDVLIDGDLLDPDAAANAPIDVPDVDEAIDEAYEGGAYEVAEASSRYESGSILDLPPEENAPQGNSVDTDYVDVTEVASAADSTDTYAQDDLIGAAEGLFGSGAEGLARLIQDVLSEQGEPTGYIVGREGGGAFVLGVRYGSGTLHHAVEGNMPVYWTGPSIGLDAGANAGNTFVLVYNLYDSEDLYERFPAGEGQAYFVGGFTASYVRRGDIVLIPIRVGAGLRLGINAGYMRFSHKQRWLPF